MNIKSRATVLAIFGLPIVANAAAADKVVFYPNSIKIVQNQDGIGGKLLYCGKTKPIAIYSFEKKIEYLISPGLNKIAIADLAGTAAFSIFAVNGDLSCKMLDSKIYSLKPILKNYSSVYPTVKKWVTNNVLLLDVVAYGPFKKGVTQEIHFEMKLTIQDD